jgi:hypothetical protein
MCAFVNGWFEFTNSRYELILLKNGQVEKGRMFSKKYYSPGQADETETYRWSKSERVKKWIVIIMAQFLP